MRLRPLLEGLFKLAPGSLGDVEERPERPRREERGARAPEGARLTIDQAEPAEQRGLAHARLATDEHEAASPTRLLQPLPQIHEKRSPLQHGGLYTPSP